jgi:uncharacterized protein (DUF1697 family)
MRYIAIIRGVGPGNPNMKGEKLKEAFERLGFTNVSTVIASGNVVFDSPSKDTAAIETIIEEGLTKYLKFSRTTIVRSAEEIKKLIDENPFKGIEDKQPNYLVVTFFKKPRKHLAEAVDMSKTDGPSMMRKLEKTHGKDITTRTWKTVNRIFKKMSS